MTIMNDAIESDQPCLARKRVVKRHVYGDKVASIVYFVEFSLDGGDKWVEITHFKDRNDAIDFIMNDDLETWIMDELDK